MISGNESVGQKLYRRKIHHIVLWVGYFVFWFFFYKNYYSSYLLLIIVIGVYFVCNATAFYVTAYYLFPKFLYIQKYGKFFLYFLILILALAGMLTVCLYFLFRDIPG